MNDKLDITISLVVGYWFLFCLFGFFLERIKKPNYFIIRVLNNCVEHKLKHMVQKKMDKDDDKVPKKIKTLTAKTPSWKFVLCVWSLVDMMNDSRMFQQQ